MNIELSDGKIIIRKIVPEHIPLLFNCAFESRNELNVWLPWFHPDYNIEETKTWVNSQQSAWQAKMEYSFGIFKLETDEFVGGCGLNQINWIHKIANLGFWIGTKHTGNGFATSAAKLCAEFGFKMLKLNRIEIVASEKNIKSQRVAEKSGATKECFARNRLVVGKNIHNAFVYSLIKEDIIKD